MNQPLIISLVIALYFGALILIAHFSSKGANNSTYFTGNRNMAWPLVALAMVTAPISGLTFISVPGMVASKGFSYLQMCLGFIVGYFLIAWVLVPLFYRHKIISIYSFLDNRFGRSTYKTGAWLFLISEVLGIGVRFMVVCVVLQLLVFEPLNLPFALNVAVTMFLIWLYTARGGVKSVIWSDSIKSIILISSVIVCFIFVSDSLGISLKEVPGIIADHPSSRIFHFDNIMESSYFWKQFLTGVFIVVAMTGLDQDLMQRILACKNPKDSRKNMAVSGVLQFVVIALFLALGVLLMLYMERHAIEMPQKTDDIFATVAFDSEIPMVISIIFILGLVSASYSSVGSALTSLTTSFTVDILEGTKKYEEKELKKKRKLVHTSMALVMGIVIIACYYLNEQDAISALFTLASYTYGPILGLFTFGIFSKRQVETKWIPVICIMSPVLSWLIAHGAKALFNYETGYELFLLNALLTIAGLYLLPAPSPANETDSSSIPASDLA
ncbi:MAG: sodium:solute symporter [Muribaculaceae bacterium]|nr:sodium:solute symporter [Muribaculaceae bacterium]